MRYFLLSKIHKAIITEASLDYIGSITIYEALMKKADLLEYVKVLVVDNSNGNRFGTYVIKGERNSDVVCTNGASAHLIKKGHDLIIMAFGEGNSEVAQERTCRQE